MQARVQHATVVLAILLAAHVASAQLHDIPGHGLQVDLPPGWQRIEALSGNTILKLARTDTPDKEARIFIGAIPAEEKIDLSTISPDDYTRILKSGSIFGEEVSVLNVGRIQVAGIDALWGKTHRDLPSRGSTYEYTYEFLWAYKGVLRAFTIRLTSYGDHNWFQSNSAAFDQFIQSIRLGQLSQPESQAAPQSQARTGLNPTRDQSSRPSRQPRRIEFLNGGDPLWLALLKSIGKVFLLLLLAAIPIGAGKWVYSKYIASHKSKDGNDPNGG